MTKDEALKLALDDVKKNERHHNVAETRYWCNQYKLLATQAIKALTQPAQEPAAWLEPTGNEWFEWWRVSKVADETEAEIDFADFLIIAQAVVAKLKDKIS